MAFGVKIKTLKTNNAYSLEGLYDIIKDKEFSAGKPEWTKNGLAYVITFPALDSQNQVWIMAAGFGKETKKFSIQKQEQAGVGNALKNAALDKVTNGVFGFGKMVGGNAKRCEELVELTLKELEALGL